MGGQGSGRGIITLTHDNCGGKLASVYISKKDKRTKHSKARKFNEALKVCLKCNKVVKITITQVTLK